MTLGAGVTVNASFLACCKHFPDNMIALNTWGWVGGRLVKALVFFRGFSADLFYPLCGNG